MRMLLIHSYDMECCIEHHIQITKDIIEDCILLLSRNAIIFE